MAPPNIINCYPQTTSRDSPLPSLDYLKISGGIFHDCAVHDIDLITWILGEYPTEVNIIIIIIISSPRSWASTPQRSASNFNRGNLHSISGLLGGQLSDPRDWSDQRLGQRCHCDEILKWHTGTGQVLSQNWGPGGHFRFSFSKSSVRLG